MWCKNFILKAIIASWHSGNCLEGISLHQVFLASHRPSTTVSSMSLAIFKSHTNHTVSISLMQRITLGKMHSKLLHTVLKDTKTINTSVWWPKLCTRTLHKKKKLLKSSVKDLCNSSVTQHVWLPRLCCQIFNICICSDHQLIRNY